MSLPNQESHECNDFTLQLKFYGRHMEVYARDRKNQDRFEGSISDNELSQSSKLITDVASLHELILAGLRKESQEVNLSMTKQENVLHLNCHFSYKIGSIQKEDLILISLKKELDDPMGRLRKKLELFSERVEDLEHYQNQDLLKDVDYISILEQLERIEDRLSIHEMLTVTMPMRTIISRITNGE